MLLGVLFFFTSCMDTFYATKRSTFDQAIASVQGQLANEGLKSVGSSSDTKNNLYAAGTSYSRYTGYGTLMENNFVTQDTYRFADADGNTMSYSVSYSAKLTSDGLPYVENVEVCGCETSNPKDYERLCGKESSVKQINLIPKDQELKKMNVMNTTLAITGITVGVSLIIYLIALSSLH